jgi:hypothetical protein
MKIYLSSFPQFNEKLNNKYSQLTSWSNNSLNDENTKKIFEDENVM